MINTNIQPADQLSLFNQQTVPLTLDLIKNIPLQRYPTNKLHYLVYALQNGHKPPSNASIRRSQRRNQIKNGANKAKRVTGRLRPIFTSLPFNPPNKFYPIPEKKPFVAKSKPAIKRSHPHRAGRVVPKAPVSLPQQKQIKNYTRTLPKTRKNAARALSPEWIALKAERAKFMAAIEEHRKNLKETNKKTVPQYFRKKKASQKRRRRQKHLLIKANRKALSEIFGEAIFRRGWPVSRKEIKLALGIKEEDHMKTQFLGQFLEMAETKRIKQTPKDDQLSRKIRRVSTDTSNSIKTGQSIKTYTIVSNQMSIPVIDDSDFPSLLNTKPSTKVKNNMKK